MKEKEFKEVKGKIIKMVKESEDVIIFGSKNEAGIIGNEPMIMGTLGTIIGGLKEKGMSKSKIQLVVNTVYEKKDRLEEKLEKAINKVVEELLND